MLLPVAFRVLAWNEVLPEFQLHPVTGALMSLIIEAVRTELHFVDVGAGPDDMKMGPVVLSGVEHKSAGLVVKPQFLPEDIGGALPLLERHAGGVFRGGAYLGVVEAIIACVPLARACQSRKYREETCCSS